MTMNKLRSFTIQAVVLIAVILFVVFFIRNAAENLQAMGLTAGFDFLWQTAGFDISFTVIEYDRTQSTFFRVLLVGITNTLVVSIVAIVLATILGVVVGVLQLLDNPPLAKLCRAYIELARNIPLLLQLIFWYTVVLSALPNQRASITIFDSVFLNIRGLFIPWPDKTPSFLPVMICFIIGVIIWIVLARHSARRRVEFGKATRGGWFGFGILLILGIGSSLLFGSPFNWTYPVLSGFNFNGGAWLPPEFIALLLGLTIYTAAFIGELVRGGISAVPPGQKEAATSLGLSRWRVMRLVLIPQALRIIVPPLTSQYLNIIKNSSLAVAIAYPDIVSVFTGTALNQTGRAIEIVAITMGFYLTISLLISALMNWYNRRVALVTR